ncbi:uncharacterized protein LOC129225934 [Uloborus diversus]|uniref:uncharacterized protein LOC129225934 n=1 Tax=Uloborus diversus TaxID=327109 RepID=UPI0024092065|nr:uncharacterized protein LOC129225934 [Uloborus diversus]
MEPAPNFGSDVETVQNTTCESRSRALAQRITESETHLYIIGLFDVHEDSGCHILKPTGMEQLLMTIGMLENRFSDVNSSQFGFDIYDTCSNGSSAIINLIHALLKAKALEDGNGGKRHISVIGPRNPDVQQQISYFLKSLQIPYFPLMITSMKMEIKAMAEVLLDLKWMTVAVFTTTKSLEDEFRIEASLRNICIAASIIFQTKTRSTAFHRMLFHELSSSGVQVAVVLGSNIDVIKLHEMATLFNSSIQYWLLAGMDMEDIFLSSSFGPDQPIIMFKTTNANLPKFDSNMTQSYEFGEKINKLNLVKSFFDYFNGCEKNDKSPNDSRCREKQLENRNPMWTITVETVNRLTKDLEERGIINAEELNKTEEKSSHFEDPNDTLGEVEIWTHQHDIRRLSKHKALLVGHFKEGRLVWDIKRLNIFRFMGSGWFKIPEFHCRKNCQELCRNFNNISVTTDTSNLFSRIYYWKHSTWVTVLLTTSSIGTLISLFTAAFLVAKSCKDDFDEGNEGVQISNVILLIAIIFSYCCTLLFVFQVDSGICIKRVNIVGVAYVLMLAPIVSRCFVLIAAEMDGIHGHVSGFTQSILCFFIMGVQFAMAIYHWMMNNGNKYINPKCIFSMKDILVYFSYSMLLSVLWLVTSAFCARSRRNNKEGLFLHVGSIAVCLVWLAWYLLLFLMSSSWNEFTICFGLVATATAILLVIFLPKVYRILVVAAANENGQVGMQPVIFASCSSRSPNLSIYESVNHGYNPDKDGYIVDVFRDDEESPGLRKMTHL